MKSIEEIGNIFIEEAKNIIDNNYVEFSDLANACLNKTSDSAQKFQVLLQKFKNRLPERGVTKEEFELFAPHITDYTVELIPYILHAMTQKEVNNDKINNSRDGTDSQSDN